MATIEGRMTICDRCKAEHFSKLEKKIPTDGGYSETKIYEDLPEGWNNYCFSSDIGTLCPCCDDEYKKMIAKFKEGYYN